MKLLAEQPSQLTSSTPYIIMFGPDKCGSEDRVHFIFRHQNPITKEFEEKHMTERPRTKGDTLTHLYTLHIMKNNSFQLYPMFFI